MKTGLWSLIDESHPSCKIQTSQLSSVWKYNIQNIWMFLRWRLLVDVGSSWWCMAPRRPCFARLSLAGKDREIQFKIFKEPILIHLIIPRPYNLVSFHIHLEANSPRKSRVIVHSGLQVQDWGCEWIKAKALSNPNMWARLAKITMKWNTWWLYPWMSYRSWYHLSRILKV